MSAALQEKISSAITRMAELLEEARKALRGEGLFGVDEIHKFQEPLNEMAEIMRDSDALRKTNPDICPQLDLYTSQLLELQNTLDQVRVMLLTQQAHLLAGRVHLDAVTHWMAAFQATR